MVRVRVFITAIMLCLGVSCIQAQALAVKTNLLSDMTLTPTIGGEVSLGTRSSLNLVYGINPWTFRSDTHGHRKAKFWVLMPEYRWWSCSVFNGHFFGRTVQRHECQPSHSGRIFRRRQHPEPGASLTLPGWICRSRPHLRIPMDTVAPLEPRSRSRPGIQLRMV